MYPDFIGIGAQKAGTTWLYRNIQNHPQIWMPRKEVHYFDQKRNSQFSISDRLFGKSPEDYRWRRQVKNSTMTNAKNLSVSGLTGTFRYYMRQPDDEWYASLFKPGKGRITGEITPSYSILKPEKISHVHEIMPDTKIIFMMRNPVERAWSSAIMYFDKVEGQSADIVSEKQFRDFSDSQSRLLTDYLRTIENWSRFYPEEQIFVGFLEDVHFFPNRLLRRVYRFLGADVSAGYRVMNRKIHSRKVEQMPVRMATYLARSYRKEIEALSERFGGYASFWLYCAQRLIDDPPDEEYIAYPLWESFLWDEWLDSTGKSGDETSGQLKPQSGTLSSVQSVGDGG